MSQSELFLVFARAAALVLLLGLAAGCRSMTPASNFYTLSAVSTMPDLGSKVSGGSGQWIALGVGPVNLPKALDRPQIVTRPSANRLQLAEFHRWGGSLEDEFTRVLAENLSELLGTDKVAVYPWEESFSPTHRLVVDVWRFDGVAGRSVTLDARWSVADAQGREPLAVGRKVIEEPVTADSYEALVAAESRALAKLSGEIAEQISTLERPTRAR